MNRQKLAEILGTFMATVILVTMAIIVIMVCAWIMRYLAEGLFG